MGDDAAPGMWEPAAPSVVSSAFASLSVDQLAAQYQAEGYVLLPQLLAEEAVATALADAERVLAESVKAVGITVTVGDVGAETGRGAGGVGSGGRGGGEEG